MNWERVKEALLQEAPAALETHILMVVITITLGSIIIIPIAVFLTRPRFRKYGQAVMSVLNLMQTIPAMTILALAMPFLGIGLKPSILALLFMSLMPIAKNALIALDGVNHDVKEAAMGMGMSPTEVLMKVEFPLAMPVIITGIKTATVLVVSSATLASFIGGGGLGDLIVLGLNVNWPEYMIVGAVLAAILATCLDRLLSIVSLKFVPPGTTLEE